MIALVDYRAGNLTSVRKALAAVGAEVFTPDTAEELARAAGIIVPGVGHFGATRVLDESWKGAIREAVDEGRPLLGICLGLQWLFDGSDEAPDVPGLGLFSGRCFLLGSKATDVQPAATRPAWLPAQAKFQAPPPAASAASHTGTHAAKTSVKVPHVGWNALAVRAGSLLLDGIPSGAQAYFTHSYAAPITPECVATTEHGVAFASVVERGLVFGAQFHPEKSSSTGLALLKNFVAFAGGR